jgi:hypothetical protein
VRAALHAQVSAFGRDSVNALLVAHQGLNRAFGTPQRLK